MVWARSCAEMPVVMPSRASIETVNAVSKADSFLAAIRSRPSSSQRSGERARQMSPRPSLAMKLIASGVANWAASVRSPSFSRSSSSQTTTMRPARISSSASSTVANGRLIAQPALRAYLSALSCDQLLHILGEHIDFQVDGCAGLRAAQRRALEGLGDQGHGKARVVDGRHGERDAVDGDGAFFHDVAQESVGRGERY